LTQRLNLYSGRDTVWGKYGDGSDEVGRVGGRREQRGGCPPCIKHSANQSTLSCIPMLNRHTPKCIPTPTVASHNHLPPKNSRAWRFYGDQRRRNRTGCDTNNCLLIAACGAKHCCGMQFWRQPSTVSGIHH